MPPKQITDRYRLMLFYDNEQIPGFAAAFSEFEEMWEHADYSEADKRSIYESVLLAVLRKTCSISDQTQLDPVLHHQTGPHCYDLDDATVCHPSIYRGRHDLRQRHLAGCLGAPVHDYQIRQVLGH